MKRAITIGLLGAILAVAVGFISTNAISATPFLMAGNQVGPNESVYMLGHVEYTVKDAQGQIKQYAQGDNAIVESGKDCSAQRIFNASDNSGTGTSVCGINGDGFNFIAIGNGSGAVDGTELQLDTDAPTNTGEIDRVAGTVSIDNSGTDAVATITTATPFAFTGISSTIVEQSGLFDIGTAAGGNMFSMRDNLGINVTSADTLSVTWKITLAGS